jgi:hypothetical protein
MMGWLIAGLALLTINCGGSTAAAVDGGLPVVCEPGVSACWQDKVATCVSTGVGWTADDCANAQVCLEGACHNPLVTITTRTLPDGMVGNPYASTLEATGGLGALSWSVLGDLPPGVELDGGGLLGGVPTTEGVYALEVQVRDATGSRATASLALVVLPPGLAVTTTSLPAAQHGLPYAATLTALGGLPPYAWAVSGGALPGGLTLTSDGRLEGAPTELGVFPITFRVFDHAIPPALAERELPLTVDVAPLVIQGGQLVDLLVAKVIVLPLIVVVPGLPVPYSTPLQATGGLTPYHWSEIEMPAALRLLISTGGIPTGLTLNEDGTLHGAVTDASQIITVNVPLSSISLTGFFFAAQVQDSQSPAATRVAIFLLPTVPLG